MARRKLSFNKMLNVCVAHHCKLDVLGVLTCITKIWFQEIIKLRHFFLMFLRISNKIQKCDKTLDI